MGPLWLVWVICLLVLVACEAENVVWKKLMDACDSSRCIYYYADLFLNDLDALIEI